MRKKFRGYTALGLLQFIMREKLGKHPEGYDQHHCKLEQRDAEGNVYGTTCCIAGETLCEMRPERFRRAKDSYYDFMKPAQRILGLSDSQASYLFDCDAAGQRRVYNQDTMNWKDDVKGHAQRGIRHIKRFIEAHKAQLRAKRVR